MHLPGQWHVQDLVRPQLPHPCGEHTAARQCARYYGGGAAESAIIAAMLNPMRRVPRGVRRRRVHDELRRSWRRRCNSSSISSCSSCRTMLAYGMIRWKQAADGHPGFRHDIRQSRTSWHTPKPTAFGGRQGGERTDGLVPALEAGLPAGGGVHLVAVPIDYSENISVPLSTSCRNRVPGAEPSTNSWE